MEIKKKEREHRDLVSMYLILREEFIPQLLIYKAKAKKKKKKSENKQARLHQSKKLPHSRGDHQQNREATYWMWENIYKS